MSNPSPFLIGELGGKFLVQQLSSATNPFKVIEDFRDSNGIRYPEAVQCLPLLDLHHFSRSDVYGSVTANLRERLVKRLDSLNQQTLENLLEQSFPFISFEELQAIPMTILRLLKVVPAKFLKQLSANTALYQNCPIEVKRQIWQINEDLFKEEAFAVIYEYIQESNVYSSAFDMYLEPNTPPPLPPRRRKDSKGLQDLVQLIGNSVQLYNLVAHFLRLLYVNTHNPLFCTLRADLLMALHDVGLASIHDLDPCHNFAWCLDACIKDNNVDMKRVQEMQLIWDNVPQKSPILGDFAMIVGNPYAMNTLARAVFGLLVQTVKSKELPKKNENLRYAAQLMVLGFASFDMLKNQQFKFPHHQKDLYSGFFVGLGNMIAEDFARLERQQQDVEAPVAPRTIDKQVESFFLSNSVARHIVFYYFLTRVQKRDDKTVSLLLTLVEKLDTKLYEERDFIQSLISMLITVKAPALRTMLIDNFLLKHKDASIFIYKQLIRFLTEANMRIPLKDLVTYLQKLVTGSSNDPQIRSQLVPVYEMFLARVGQRVNEQHVPFLFEYLQRNSQTKPQTTPQDAHFGSPQYNEMYSTSPHSSSPREPPLHTPDTRPSPRLPQGSPQYSQPSPKITSPRYGQTSPQYRQPSPKYTPASPPYTQTSPKYSTQASPPAETHSHSPVHNNGHANEGTSSQDTAMEDVNPQS